MSDVPKRSGSVLERLWSAPATRWVLLLAVILLLLLDAYGLSVFPRGSIDHERFGDLGSWFQGLLTVAVVAIAAMTLQSQREKLLASAKEKEEERKAAERLDVGRVYAWLDKHLDPGRGTVLSTRVICVNATTIPLYDWLLEIEGMPDLDMTNIQLGPLLPGTRHLEPNSPGWQRLKSSALPRVSIRFVAANGETLRRDYAGRLQAVTPAAMTYGQ